MAAYEVLLLNTTLPQIQAAQAGDTYVVPRDITFSTNATFTTGTANGVMYLNGDKVVSTGSLLTFNGTTFTAPSLSLTNALSTTSGGTGLSSFTAGDLTYYSTGTALSKLAIGTANQVLTSSGTAPQWTSLSSIGVTSVSFGSTGLTPSSATAGAVSVAGTLVTSNGGTGLSSYTAGDLVYYSTGTALSKLAIGTASQILTSSGSAPQWSTASGISVGTATNLAGGAAGSVPYQSWAGATTFLSIGAADRVLTSTGSAPQWVTSLTGLTGVSSSSITNTGLTSGRVVYSTTGGAQTDSASLTFDGTTFATTTVDITNLEVTNIKAKDGTAAASIADSTGIISITSNPVLSGGTANGVLYLNGSKVATSGSALTFDGTNFATTGSGTLKNLLLSGGTLPAAGNPSISLRSSDNVIYHQSGSANTIVMLDSSQNTMQSIGATAQIWNISNSERMRLDSSGNLGLGVTPSAWSGFTVLESTNGNSVYFGSSQASLGSNAYNDGAGWKYKTTAPAGLFTNVQGVHSWYTAPSGTAGNAITFTQAMTLDASGNLGVGATSPVSALDIYRASGANVNISHSISGGTYPKASGIGFGATSTSYSVSSNGGTVSFYGGAGIYAENTASSGNPTNLVFWTNLAGTPAERARITSDGNFLVGTTSTTPAQSNVSGFKVGSGQIECNGTDTQAAFFGRSNDGQVVRFFNAGATAGNISNTGTTTSYNGTSDYRLKENVQPMTDALSKVQALKPCTFTWKNDGRLGQGFIAHELQEVIPDAVQGEKDAVDKDGNPEYQGIDPRMVVATLTAAIQEQQTIIQSLTARIAALESKGV